VDVKASIGLDWGTIGTFFTSPSCRNSICATLLLGQNSPRYFGIFRRRHGSDKNIQEEEFPKNQKNSQILLRKMCDIATIGFPATAERKPGALINCSCT
jgi:hypothetical protein